jgi:acetyl-CoA synthetase
MSDVLDYRAVYEAFEPLALTEGFDGDLGAGINACVECCDRHVGDGRVALNRASVTGERAEFTFEQLQERSAQVANLLVEHGVEPGDCVSGLLPRVPDLVALILGCSVRVASTSHCSRRSVRGRSSSGSGRRRRRWS